MIKVKYTWQFLHLYCNLLPEKKKQSKNINKHHYFQVTDCSSKILQNFSIKNCSH